MILILWYLGVYCTIGIFCAILFEFVLWNNLNKEDSSQEDLKVWDEFKHHKLSFYPICMIIWPYILAVNCWSILDLSSDDDDDD